MTGLRTGKVVAALTAASILHLAASPVTMAPAFAQDAAVSLPESALGKLLTDSVRNVYLYGVSDSVLKEQKDKYSQPTGASREIPIADGYFVREDTKIGVSFNWQVDRTSVSSGDYLVYKMPEILAYGEPKSLKMVYEKKTWFDTEEIHYADAYYSADGLLVVVFNDDFSKVPVNRGTIYIEPPLKYADAVENVEILPIELPGYETVEVNYLPEPYAFNDGAKISASGELSDGAVSWDVSVPAANRVLTNSTFVLTPADASWAFDVDAIEALGAFGDYEVVSVSPDRLELRAPSAAGNTAFDLSGIPGVVAEGATGAPSLNVAFGGDQAESAGSVVVEATPAQPSTTTPTTSAEPTSSESTPASTSTEPSAELSTEPSATDDPAAPSTSTEPVAPTTTVVESTTPVVTDEPVAPTTEPAEPTTPVAPTTVVEPTKPVDPTTPSVEPSKPETPSTPVVTDEPEVPTTPSVEPTKPVVPTTPVVTDEPAAPSTEVAEPTKPEVPTTPVVPPTTVVEPTKPVVPTTPSVEPSKPETPSTPVVPPTTVVEPTKPVVPTTPSVEPTKPVVPTTPVVTDEPAAPSTEVAEPTKPVVPTTPSVEPSKPAVPTTPVVTDEPVVPTTEATAPTTEIATPTTPDVTEEPTNPTTPVVTDEPVAPTSTVEEPTTPVESETPVAPTTGLATPTGSIDDEPVVPTIDVDDPAEKQPTDQSGQIKDGTNVINLKGGDERPLDDDQIHIKDQSGIEDDDNDGANDVDTTELFRQAQEAANQAENQRVADLLASMRGQGNNRGAQNTTENRPSQSPQANDGYENAELFIGEDTPNTAPAPDRDLLANAAAGVAEQNSSESVSQPGRRIPLNTQSQSANDARLPIQRDVERARNNGRTSNDMIADQLARGPQGETHELRAAEKGNNLIPASDIFLNGLAAMIILGGIATLITAARAK